MTAQRRQELRILLRFAGFGIVVAGLGYLAATQADTHPAPILVAAACFTAALLVAGGLVVAAGFEPPPGSLRSPSLRRRRTDRESGGLQRVARTVERSTVEVDRFNDRLRPWLVRLAAQRLRRRGADLDALLESDPDSVRNLLGDSLCTLIRHPLTTAPTQQQLTDWVSRIEAL